MGRTRSLHLLLALAFAVALSAMPLERVAACSCAFTELPDAIGAADVAIVGRLVAQSGPVDRGPMPMEQDWTWEVERTREPIDAHEVTVSAWPDDGANCGVTFGVGERWLILASVHEGRLGTNGCMRNHPIDGSDPEAEALIGDLVPLTVGVSAAAETTPSIPAPLLVAVGVVMAMVLIGSVAFRRPAR